MAMSDPDLVERTRRSMQQTNERDFDGALAIFAPDAVFDVSAAGVGCFEGRDAVRAYLEDWVGSYERQHYRSWEGTELAGGVVFVVADLEALPAGSTASVQERWAFTVLWRDGAICRVTAGQDVEGARAAAHALAANASPEPNAREDVEIVRDSMSRWRRTGEPPWELIHPDAEVHDHDIMDAGEYRGRAGIERWLDDWESAWSESAMHAEEFIDAGSGTVVVLVKMRATGRGSAVSVERQDAIVHVVRDGLIVRLDYYNDRPRALEAAGVSPR
jgi:ketosteroid isomerase-like protein